jgi:hypothetical protein
MNHPINGVTNRSLVFKKVRKKKKKKTGKKKQKKKKKTPRV